ncbi:hypothetical protein M8J76_015602 [Diaphorina citri]|nr:hypothetical protein M8J76_001968 [Diaphorina citri]KAI5737667.1 hypothetical protein M8J76_015602 [Diaphorina citri]
MGDHDQSRDHRRKRHNKGYRAKEKDDGNPFPSSKKAPSILTKSSAEKNAHQTKSVESSLQVPNQPKQPTIILKSRDASSPNPRSKTDTANGPSNNTPKTPSTDVQSLLAPYPHMQQTAVKLIDENLEFHAGLVQSFLTEQTDFTVIGVIGLQGTGKSTLLSQLVSNAEHSIFPVQTQANILECTHCTTGMDIYVSSNRLILLDTQPILSPSLMDISVMQRKTSPIYDAPGVNKSSAEYASLEIHSLQLSAFIFSVCHVVLFVQDWFIDPNLVRFIQATEMLKPSNITNRPEEYYEYFPEGVFIHNKVPSCDFLKHNIGDIQEFYSNTFAKSKLIIHSGKNLVCEDVESEVSLCNVYQVPEMEDTANFTRVMSTIKKHLSGTSRRNFTINTLLLYAAKIWDHIRKSSYFLEYNRYLP